MSNTEYATDVVMKEVSQLVGTIGLATGSSSGGVGVRPQPPVPTAPSPVVFDFAYLTIGDMIDLVMTIDGTSFDYDMYSAETGGDWRAGSYFVWLINKAIQRGIGIYNSYDSFGCWRVYRVQNLLSVPRDVSFNIDFSRYEDYELQYTYGLMPLVEVSTKLENPTVAATSSAELREGYDRIKFRLEPNTRKDLALLGNPLYISWAGSQIELIGRLGSDSYYTTIEINGQYLINSETGGIEFHTADPLHKNALILALTEQGIEVSYSSSSSSDGTNERLTLDIYGNVREETNMDTPYKLTITQHKVEEDMSSPTTEMYVSETGLKVYRNIDPDTGSVSITAYLYDPLYLEYIENT